MEEKRLFDILNRYANYYPQREVAFAGRQNGQWVKYSPAEYIQIINNVSYALIKLGIMPGDKVAIVSGNCPQWNMVDMAVMQVGAVPVPIYPTVTENDYVYILNHCEARIAFIDGSSVLRVFEHIGSKAEHLEHIYTFTEKDNYESFAKLVRFGEDNADPDTLNKRKDAVKYEDLATIIYTSGTTGTPKGVMLSHANFLSQIESVRHIFSKWSDTAYSFLPLSHAYERMAVYLYQYLGMSVYYAQSFATIAQDIKEVNPTFMTVVPRLLEKIYEKIIASGSKLKGVKKMIFFWAVNLGKRYKMVDSDRSAFYNFKIKIADKLVYSQIRKNIGGHFDIIGSGAASIQKQLVSFFTAVGIPVFEGYGLTETSPIIAVACRDKYGCEAGTVGFPLKGVEVRIDPDTQELCCRGHNVMMGYYKNEELTREVIDKDGWFHTGDLGKINERGQVIILGRLKSLFKTSNGKYVNPDVMEVKFSESRFFEYFLVVGEGQKFPGALVVPDFEFLKEWCRRHAIEYTNPKDIITNKAVTARYWLEIEKYNALFGNTEKIKKFTLIADEWNIQNGILTPTLKVKRKVVTERYNDVIAKMFE